MSEFKEISVKEPDDVDALCSDFKDVSLNESTEALSASEGPAKVDEAQASVTEESSSKKKKKGGKKSSGSAGSEPKLLYIAVVLNAEQIAAIIAGQELSEYIVNQEFHITLLYIGGREDVRVADFVDLVGKECTVLIDKIALSDKYCTLGVSSIQINEITIPYFGNPIKHVTIARKDGFKPVDSPSSFTDGVVTVFDKPEQLIGIIKDIKKD